MAPLEDITYFVYNEGIDPSILNLGTLLFDYANARRTRKGYRHGEIEEELLKTMTTQDERPVCSIVYSQNSGTLFDVGVNKFVEGGHAYAKSSTRLVVGRNGSKMELKEEDKFFDDYLLKQEAVRDWFRTRLTVAKNMSSARATIGNLVSSPRIWLLTGVYFLEDGQSYSIRTETSSSKATAKMPVPDPTGWAPLIGKTVGATIGLGKGIEAIANTQIKGRMVWAAQWTRVRAKYVASRASAANPEAVMKGLKLLEETSQGTERGPEEDENGDPIEPTVHMVLGGKGVRASEYESVEWNEEQWDEFEERVDELALDLEDAR